jgi:GGDEF domain-containing protein
MLADAGLEAATDRAGEILLDFDATPSPAAAGVAIRLSAGTAAGHPVDLIRIRADADVALYRAKSVGGHRVGRAASPLEAATVPGADQLVKNPAGSPT